jgi:hypothetical protein
MVTTLNRLRLPHLEASYRIIAYHTLETAEMENIRRDLLALITRHKSLW